MKTMFRKLLFGVLCVGSCMAVPGLPDLVGYAELDTDKDRFVLAQQWLLAVQKNVLFKTELTQESLISSLRLSQQMLGPLVRPDAELPDIARFLHCLNYTLNKLSRVLSTKFTDEDFLFAEGASFTAAEQVSMDDVFEKMIHLNGQLNREEMDVKLRTQKKIRRCQYCVVGTCYSGCCFLSIWNCFFPFCP